MSSRNDSRNGPLNRPINRRNFLGYAVAVAAGAALWTPASSALALPRTRRRPATTTGEISFWSNHPGGSLDVEKELISRFEAEHPGITVNLVDGGANYEEVAQKFNAALAGGDLPDVVVLSDVWWFNFALLGAITPLDDLFGDAGVDTADFVDALLADYLFDGQHFALPYARSTPLFYYDQELWSQVGLEDRGPATWEEWDEWAPEIQAAAGDGNFAHGWGNGQSYLGWTFQGPNWTKGGSYSEEWALNFDSDETVAAAQWLSDMINVHGVAAVANDLANEFSTGFYGSVIASTGDLKGITDNATFEFNTAPLPLGPNGEIGCCTGGAGLAVPAGIDDERKLNALRFIDFVTNAANTSYFTQNTGYMPVRKSAVEDPAEAEFLDANPRARTAIDQLANTRSQDYARVFVPGADQIIGAGLESIGLAGADVAATMADLTSQLQTIIDRDITPKLPA